MIYQSYSDGNGKLFPLFFVLNIIGRSGNFNKTAGNLFPYLLESGRDGNGSRSQSSAYGISHRDERLREQSLHGFRSGLRKRTYPTYLCSEGSVPTSRTQRQRQGK